MNASQPTTASGAAAPMPAFVPVLNTGFDDDYAIGCECADPALQIERWAQAGDGMTLD